MATGRGTALLTGPPKRSMPARPTRLAKPTTSRATSLDAAEAAGLDTGVGVGVPTMGWPVTSDADDVRITALATTAETNPMIRPTR